MKLSQAFSFLFAMTAISSACVGDEYCRSCPSGSCQYCAEGYISKTNNTCIKVSNTVDNCVFYQSEGVCERCRMGYQTSANGRCVPITTPNCVNVDPETGICTTCSVGIREKNGQCLEQNKCSIPNCPYCYNFNGLEYCYLCDQGYTSYKGPGTGPSCRKQGDDFTANCDTAISSEIVDLNICLICSPGYYYSIDRCIKSSKQIVQNSSETVNVSTWLACLLVAVVLTK
jgi:hypothetical protein